MPRKKQQPDDWNDVPQGEGEPQTVADGPSFANFEVDELKRLVEGIETAQRELQRVSEPFREHISDLKKSATEKGFKVKIINEMIKLRAMTPTEREEHDEIHDLYRFHLGLRQGEMA